MAAINICSDFGAQNIKSDTVSTVSPSISHEVMGLDAMILVFWMLSFKTTFPLSSFTFINRLFSSSLSAKRVMSSAYLRLLIFLLAILIPACASSSPEFLVLYSAYKLNNMCCYLFDNHHSDRYEVIYHCVLICISQMISSIEHLCMCLFAILYTFLGKATIHVLCPLLIENLMLNCMSL